MLKSKVAPSEQLSMVIAPHRGRWPYDGVPWWAKLYCRGICWFAFAKKSFPKECSGVRSERRSRRPQCGRTP